MAGSVNKVILVGNLGQDPDKRAMPSGKSVTNIRIATSESWRDKQTGEQKEQTEWHTVVFFDRLADVAARGDSERHPPSRRRGAGARRPEEPVVVHSRRRTWRRIVGRLRANSERSATRRCGVPA